MAKLINDIFPIKYPIIQAGMVWVSGAKLAAACANAGILGLVGAGSMQPELLKEHLKRAQELSKGATGTIGINIPLLYSKVEEQIKVALEAGIKIFFTSAGSPKKYTQMLKDHGCQVVHVTASPELAKKCEDAGCDAVVAEGFEAGGHNGRDELTTMVLIPQVVDAVNIPVIAAGGIYDGRTLLSALSLGAAGVQMGTRFLMAEESSAHQNYKKALLSAGPGDTILSMKSLVPVRLLKNKFYQQVNALESKCASPDELKNLLGKGRAKKGMLEGDLDEGELEVGQICSAIHSILPAKQIVQNILNEYLNQFSKLPEQF